MSAEKEDKWVYTLCIFCNQKIHIEEFAGLNKKGCFHKGCYILNEKWLECLKQFQEDLENEERRLLVQGDSISVECALTIRFILDKNIKERFGEVEERND